MKIETKYNFGDKVYKISRRRVEKRDPCGFCGGAGEITGANKEPRYCPECNGRGYETRWEPQKWQLDPGQLTIGQIRIEWTCKSKGFDLDSIFSNYGPQAGKYEEIYMCRETGVGSGSLHHVETLWPTKDEAWAECDRLNAEEDAIVGAVNG